MKEAALEMPVPRLSIVRNKVFVKVEKISLKPVCRENYCPYGLLVQRQLRSLYFQKVKGFSVVFPLCGIDRTGESENTCGDALTRLLAPTGGVVNLLFVTRQTRRNVDAHV
jgi:hypothetical protein